MVARLLHVCVFVGIWIWLGFGLHVTGDAYLLLGVPLTAIFQLFVRRQPIRALWVREAPAFRLGLSGWAIAAALACYPLYRLMDNLRAQNYGAQTLWFCAAVAGPVAASFALRDFHPATTREFWICLATAGTMGILLLVPAAFSTGIGHRTLANRLHEGATSLLLYVPVVFVLEEVSFRGAFDSHVHRSGERREYLTAFLVSGLWGLWHLPVVMGHEPLWRLVPGLVGVHCALGVLLSFGWRRSGNLFVCGFAHALVDAVRNALF